MSAVIGATFESTCLSCDLRTSHTDFEARLGGLCKSSGTFATISLKRRRQLCEGNLCYSSPNRANDFQTARSIDRSQIDGEHPSLLHATLYVARFDDKVTANERSCSNSRR